jgi:hypothetical protein
MARIRTALTLALVVALTTTACSSSPAPAERIERKTSPASMSLVATTASLVGAYRLSPLAATRVYAYTLLAAYRAQVAAAPGQEEADAATAGEIVGATLLLDAVAARELDAMRRRYSDVQTEPGRKVAQEVLRFAATDRYDEMVKVFQTEMPPVASTPQNWAWEPTGLFRTNAIEPLWGELITITSAKTTCDIPSPNFDILEQEGRAMLTNPDINGSVDKSVLLWLAGPGTPGPAGQWLMAANGYVAGLDAKDATRVLATAAVAAHDVGILLWREKFEHMTARPETMYQRWFGSELKLARETPGHPSYPSGHSGFSSAVAEVLTSIGAQQISFDLPNDMVAPAEQTLFSTPRDAVTSASASRVKAFFHYPADTRAGESLGSCAGAAALAEVPKLATTLKERPPAPPVGARKPTGQSPSSINAPSPQETTPGDQRGEQR